MTAFQAVALVVMAALAGLAVLAYFGVLPGQSSGDETGRALRALLEERAQGKIDEAEFERRQAALHASLMADADATPRAGGGVFRWVIPVVIPVVVVAAGGGLYAWLIERNRADSGPAPQAAAPAPAPGGVLSSPLFPGSGMAQGGAPAGAQPGSAGDMGTMVDRLAEKLRKDPSNGPAWLLLARGYGQLRKAREAAAAYAKAAALLPPDSDMLSDWADAHVMANDRKWDDEARTIVKRSLAANPKNLKALALAGSEAFERASYKEAIDFWERMRAAAPADSIDAKLAEANIQEAKARAGGAKDAKARP